MGLETFMMREQSTDAFEIFCALMLAGIMVGFWYFTWSMVMR
jgi:hypothetical protein